jgi:hypothetical protein
MKVKRIGRVLHWIIPAGLVAAGLLRIDLNALAPEAHTADPFPGPPPIVPRWAFEPWVWEDNTNTRSAAENLVQGYLDRNIPVGAVIIDSPWETCHNTFEWNTDSYPNPQQMIDGFHAQGVRVVVWITGFVNGDCPDYDFVKDQGYAVDGGRDFDWWQGRGVHVDFTNPHAINWWHSKADGVLGMGIDGWKVDMSPNYVSDPVSTYVGSISKQDFKKYYYADFFDYTTGHDPYAITLARPYSFQGGDGAPVSKVSVGWCGDFGGDFAGLNGQKDDAYESAQRGYGAPGVEIGGYEPPAPTRRSLIRYAQFAAMTPLMENGGRNGGDAEHLPWYWDVETVDVYRYFAILHSELVPYMFSYSVESSLTGESIVRDSDKDAAHHKLGEEIFVSVLDSDALSKMVTFPAGAEWIDYWDEARVFEGACSAGYDVPLDRYPIFFETGAVIPMNVTTNVTGHGDATVAGKTTLLVFPAGTTSFTFHRPLGDGTAYEDVQIHVDESRGTITVDGGSTTDYVLRVKSFSAPGSVTGADSWTYDAAGEYVIADRRGQGFMITIDGLRGYGRRTSLQHPYGGTPWAIPGQIEVEDYDTDGACVAYHDADAGNNGHVYRTDDVDIGPTSDAGGGYNVGWTDAGEWLEYTVNVAEPGTYRMELRVASEGAGGTLHVEFHGADGIGTAAATSASPASGLPSIRTTGTLTFSHSYFLPLIMGQSRIEIPDTGGWQSWTTVAKTISLSAGVQVMRIALDTNGITDHVGNVNWIRFTLVEGTLGSGGGQESATAAVRRYQASSAPKSIPRR